MPRSDFEKLRVYQLSEMLADFIGEIVIKRDRLAQETLGRQLINSADSIGANIAEGSGWAASPTTGDSHELPEVPFLK
jgi:four helix bundle protein